MNRFIIEGKETTNSKLHKFVGELEIAKTCEWPTKREAVAEIKAIPTSSS